jgi:hypothetical protein
VASDLPPRRSASGSSAAGRPPARRPGLARGRLAAVGLAALLLAGAALFAARRARPPGGAAPAPAEAPAAPAQPAEGLAPETVAARVAAASALAGCGEQAGRAFFVGPEEAVADVACRPEEAQLRLADGRDLLGKVTWRDALAGLSILEVPGAAAPHLPIGSAAGLAAGEPVYLVAEDGPGMAIAESRASGVWQVDLGLAYLAAAPGGASPGGGALVLDRGGRLAAVASADPAGPGPGLALPVEYLAPHLRGAGPVPEDPARWQAILSRAAEEGRRELESVEASLARPRLLQVEVAGPDRLSGLLLRTRPKAPVAERLRLVVRDGARLACTAEAAPRSWTPLAEALAGLGTAGPWIRQARWAVERGRAGDLQVGEAAIDLSGCDLDAAGPGAVVAVEGSEGVSPAVALPRAALLEERARVEERSRLGEEARRSEEEVRQQREQDEADLQEAERRWREAFGSAEARVEEQRERLGALREQERKATIESQWYQLGRIQQQIPAAERSLRRAEEELEELDRQASRLAVPRTWRQPPSR